MSNREQRAGDLLAAADDLRRRFAGTAADHDRDGSFPFANFDALFDSGLLSLTVAREHGGAGLGLREARRVVTTIARGEPATALVLGMHYIIHAAIAANHGGWPAELGSRLARESAERISLINSIQVEPGIGSPSHGGLPETIGRRRGDKYLLSGHKKYATGIPILSWITVLGVTDDEVPQIGLFLVDARAPGVKVVETWDSLGMKATASHDIIFEDVELPVAHLLDATPAAGGLKRDPFNMAWYSTLLAAVYHGVAWSARDTLVDFARGFAPGGLGGPIAGLPRVQDEIGALDIRLRTHEAVLDSAASAVDARFSHEAVLGVISARHVVMDGAVQITGAALDLAGNQGLSQRSSLGRHHRDALSARAHGPQNHILRGLIGRAALGLGAPAHVAATVPDPVAGPELRQAG